MTASPPRTTYLPTATAVPTAEPTPEPSLEQTSTDLPTSLPTMPATSTDVKTTTAAQQYQWRPQQQDLLYLSQPRLS
ncbi:hypothetical protein BGW39_006088 [Mortierella sp. 14UC]|nr:hypothetical protein BGW39_006088 [Mortierella sp. 14UC]